MDEITTRKKLIAFIREELLADQRADHFEPESPLIGEGEINSLAIMRLVVFIERELDVSVPLVDLTPENFANVDVLSKYIGARVAGTG